MRNAVQLITYIDRLGGDIGGVHSLLKNEFAGLFGGVHLLPYFTPIDGTDAGFDPTDHTAVDARLGSWEDVQKLSEQIYVMSDLIVNHVSSESSQFQDVLRRGTLSEFWDLFLRREQVFPGADADDASIDKVYRPRPGRPFTAITLNDSTTHDFWTTFGARQLDIDTESPVGRAYLESILEVFSRFGIQGIRLDAVGYAIKRAGSNCFMLPETYDFIESLRVSAEERMMDVLVEIHSHHQTQIDIAKRVSRVYDFALPPLVLHTLFNANAAALKRWLNISPRNCITVLDTHDGIGIVDAARDGERDGLLSDVEVESLVDEIAHRTDGESRLASGSAASNLDVYQVNTTFYSALGESDNLYLIARAIQFFVPGIPQVYYMGLLAAGNDMTLLKNTGVGRDINRHYFDLQEIKAALDKSVVKSLFALIRLRNSAGGFDGEFDMPACADDRLRLRWRSDTADIELVVDLRVASGLITQRESGWVKQYLVADVFTEIPPQEILRSGQ